MCFATMVMSYLPDLDSSKALVRPITPALSMQGQSVHVDTRWKGGSPAVWDFDGARTRSVLQSEEEKRKQLPDDDDPLLVFGHVAIG
jgi:hypothetical protein